MKKLLLLVATLLCVSTAFAQINIKDKIKQATNKKANEKVDQSIDKGLDEAEKSITGQDGKEEPADTPQQNDQTTPADQPGQDQQTATSPQPTKLEAYTQYDFVPGDQIIFYDDFSSDAIGDFPANWTTNGSGEIKTLNIAPGKWLHINSLNAVHTYLNKIELPTNFIFEFDMVPDEEFRWYYLNLYQESDYKEFDT
jgi:OOP family OmpA-OmpF porin